MLVRLFTLWLGTRNSPYLAAFGFDGKQWHGTGCPPNFQIYIHTSENIYSISAVFFSESLYIYANEVPMGMIFISSGL